MRRVKHISEFRMTDPTFHIHDTTASVMCFKLLYSFIDAPPSFCDMGNAISSLIAQTAGGSLGDGEECVLLSEEHSLVLTCCWVSLKVICNIMHHTHVY